MKTKILKLGLSIFLVYLAFFLIENSFVSAKNKKSWDLETLEKLSAPLQTYLQQANKPKNTLSTVHQEEIPKLDNQTLTGNLANIMINDPSQEDDLRVQSQTASAAFGNNIVVVYNRTGFSNTNVSYSFDGGKNWQETSVASVLGGVNLGNSAIAVDLKGQFYVVTVAANRITLPTIAVSRSQDGGASWLDAADVLGNEARSRFIPDRPWIAVDSSTSTPTVYVSWTRFDDTEKRSSIMFARSINGGERFTTPIEITPTSKGFNVDGSRLALGPNGEIYLSWTDNQTGTIFLAKSTNKGTSFSTPTIVATIGNLRTPKLLNGSFSTNLYASLAVDNTNTPTRGFIYLTFNARPFFNSPDKSDVFLVRSTDGGQNWSQRVKVNDDQTVTDQWMPALAVTSSGKLALSWYDRRNNPVNNSLIDVYASLSVDGGQTFQANKRITDSNWPLVPTPTAIIFGYHGEYNQISTEGETINFHWADDRSGTDPDIFFAKLDTADMTVDPKGDFNLSGRTIFATARPGENITFLCESVRAPSFSDSIQLSASSNLPNASFEFSSTEIFAGNSFNLTVSVPPQTRAGNYIINIIGSAKDRSRSTILRLNVLSNNPEAKQVANLSNSSGESTSPKIIADETGRFHAVWQDDTDGVATIFYANSLDGQEFSQPINVSKNFNPAIKPIIATDKAGQIHIIWEEPSETTSFLVYTRSSDDGKNFLPKRVVTSNIPSSSNPVFAIEADGTINLAWSAVLTDGQSALLLAQSKDSGESFSLPKIITSTSKIVTYQPVLTIDNTGVMHIAYVALEFVRQRFQTPNFVAGLFYQRAINKQLDFTEPINLIPRDFTLADTPILLANGSGQIVLLFAGFNTQQAAFDREIYFTQSFDNGASFFFAPETLSRASGDSTALTAAYGVDGVLNVLWQDTQRQNFDIFISRLVPGERNFSGPNRISQNLGISQKPALAINPQGDMLIAWSDDSIGNSEIFFTNLTSNDLPTVKITDFNPKIADINESVIVQGENLTNIVEVKVGQLSARFEELSPTQLKVTIPNGAVASAISIFSSTSQTRTTTPIMITNKVGVGQTSINFGNVATGQSLAKSFTLVNSSNTTRTVRQISFTNNGFRLGQVNLPMALRANSTVEIPIIFAPNNLSLQGSLAVINVDNDFSVALSVELIGVGLDSRSPQVTAISPKGGEVFNPGQQIKITWTAQDNTAIEIQDIQLSTDGGKTFSVPIATGLTQVREFLWTVPSIATTTGRIRIVAKDVSGNVGESITKDFTIKVRNRLEFSF